MNLKNIESKESELPSCAILLAAYNGQQWIDEQIDSILSQVGVQVKVFVSVDFSTDATLDMCEQKARSDSRVNLLPYGQKFCGAGPNFYRLISDVEPDKFDMFAFSDQDDIWYETKLQTAWQHISERGFDVFSSDVLAFWQDGRQELIKKSYPQVEFDYFFEAAGPGCTYVLSASAYTSVRSFISANVRGCQQVELHDWLIYAYCRHNNFKWHIHSMPTMLYRQHPDNQVGANNNIKAFVRRLKKIKANWYKNEIKKIFYAVTGDSVNVFFKKKPPLLNFYVFRRRHRDKFIFLISYLFGRIV